MRYEVRSWIGTESPTPLDRYRRVWSHHRARQVALQVVAMYRAQNVRDFRVAIFHGRARNPVTWFLCEDGRYEELPDSSVRLAGYSVKILLMQPPGLRPNSTDRSAKSPPA